MLKYKGYIGKASYERSINMFEGQIINATVGTFAADNRADLKKEFKKTIDIYLEVCKEQNIQPIKPS